MRARFTQVAHTKMSDKSLQMKSAGNEAERFR